MINDDMNHGQSLEEKMEGWPNWREVYKELSQPPERVMEWLRGLYTGLSGGEDARYCIGGGWLMVEVGGDCGCQSLSLEDSDALRWLHNNHVLYNRFQWRLITETIGEDAFRRILVEEIAIAADRRDGGGDLFAPGVAQEMLDNFVDTDNWR